MFKLLANTYNPHPLLCKPPTLTGGHSILSPYTEGTADDILLEVKDLVDINLVFTRFTFQLNNTYKIEQEYQSLMVLETLRGDFVLLVNLHK